MAALVQWTTTFRSDMTKGQKKFQRKTHAQSPGNFVAVGVNYLTWRFTPGSLPGLPNLLPVLCTIGNQK